MPDTWTILTAMQWTTEYFKRHDIATARLDAELLLAHVLKMERTQLYVNFDKPIHKPELAAFRQLIQRRAKGEPIAYITGRKEFWSLEFKVNPNVLIPRPETELLVQTVLDLWAKYPKLAKCMILEIGTGCGNIAISLAKELADCRIFACDISPEALEIARENAKFHRVGNKLSFRQGDLFYAFRESELKESINFIVSNPPYIPTNQLDELPAEVKYEPRNALDGGADGAYLQQKITEESLKFLAPQGHLVMETGISQANYIEQLGRNNPQWADFKTLPDYSGLARVIVGKKG